MTDTTESAVMTPAEDVHTAKTETINPEFDLELVRNPEPDPNVGLFIVKPVNQMLDEAARRPMPKKLFGQLWFENEVTILFADTNVGKSILAVQIADAISRGTSVMGLPMEAEPQRVLYCDFELSDKQFESRYADNQGAHHQFSPNLMRVEINPDATEYPQGCTFEEYLKLSIEMAVTQHQARVLVIDNLTYLSRDNEKACDALPLMKWLKAFSRQFNLSLLILAHTPKRSRSTPITRNDLQGSKMLINFCDGCFAIGESNTDKSVRYIKEIKQRNASFAYDAENVIVCEIAKPGNFLQFQFVNFGKEKEHLADTSRDNREAVIERVRQLSEQGLSQRDIATQLGVSVGVVNKYLNL